MLAEIITIGDELLIGQVTDTNSVFISKALNKLGVSVYQITSIQDDEKHILKALKTAEENASIIILTGGLGPTKDDITKTTIAKYFNDSLVKDPSVLKNIELLWKNHVKQPLTQINKDQALIPSKAKVLMNRLGSAPGMWLEKNNKIFISLPGVPFEMKAIIENEVLPKLKNTFDYPFILHKTLLVYGIGESTLAERLEEWEDALPTYIKLAYLPNLGQVRLRLTAKHKNKEVVEKEVNKQIEGLIPLIKDKFYGFEDTDTSIELIIGRRLSVMGKTLAVAESCTGGQIAQKMTSNAGASVYFNGGLVTYSTLSKINILGVLKDVIETYSVVSAQVSEIMAQNTLRMFNSDYAIATTGNAGPTKGDSNAEVGTVFIAIASKKGVFSRKFNMGNTREKVVNKTVNKAFELLLKEIFENR